jgi:hypothetical protein
MIATAPASDASKRSFYLVITVAALLVGAALGAQLARSGMPDAPPRARPRVWTERPTYVPPPPPQTFAQPPPPVAPVSPFTAAFPSCARYVEVIEEFIQCDKIPEEARVAAQQGIDAMMRAWTDIGDAERHQAEQGCQAAVEAVADASATMGCYPSRSR